MKLGDALPMAALGLSLYGGEGCHHRFNTAQGYEVTVVDEEFTYEDMIDSGVRTMMEAVRLNATNGVIDCPQSHDRGYPSYVAAEMDRCAGAVAKSVTFSQIEGLWANAVEANLYCGQNSVDGFNQWFWGGGSGDDLPMMMCVGAVLRDFGDAIGRKAKTLSALESGYVPCWTFDMEGNYRPYEADPEDPGKNANGGCYAE